MDRRGREGVEDLSPGDRVLASVRGGFAEFAVGPAAGVVKAPDGMSFEQMAGFKINYITALHGLRDRVAIQPGERLLVLGAAGGVGLAAVQVGKRLGAHVAAAASTQEKRNFALANGADEAIDTNAEGWRDRLKALYAGGGPDVVFDPVCGPLFELAFRSLSWRGATLSSDLRAAHPIATGQSSADEGRRAGRRGCSPVPAHRAGTGRRPAR